MRRIPPEEVSPLNGQSPKVCQMDMTDAGSQDTRYPDQGLGDGHLNNLDDVSHRVDEINSKVDTLDQRLSEVEQFYSSTSKKQSNNSKGSSIVKDKNAASCKKRQSDAASREVASSKRMQELIRQFGTIMRQLTQHKWASPFMDPVDVKGLELDDYFEVIKKPMDFSTIKAKMEAKDGNGYKNVREICADVRLIFKNAMKYNDERHDVHVMAKTLLEKFEEKWLQLLPKVDEEEKRRKDEEAEAHLDMQLAQEAAHAKMALDLRSELEEVDRYLESLREMVLQKCRRITTGEKRRLGTAISELSPENLSKVLQIVAQGNPNFQPSSDEVELDMDAQSEATLWKLKFFVKEAMDAQGRTAAAAASVGDVTHNNTTTTANNKRKICDALAKTSQKKSKKLP